MRKSKKRKSLVEWGIGKPPVLAWLGWMTAAYADECISFVNRVLAGELDTELPQAPEAPAMLGMHKDSRKFWEGIIDRGLGGGGAAMLAMGDAWETFLGQPEEVRRSQLEEVVHDPEFKEAYKDAAIETGKVMTADFNNMVADIGGAEIPSYLTPEFFETVKAQYLIRVFLPCFLLYGDTPHQFYQQARGGDDAALLKLLAIDKSILSDEIIAGRVHEASRSGNDAFLDDFANAVRRKPKPVERAQGKIRLAAFISLLAKIMQVKVDAPEIQELFDVVARMKRKSKTLDTDLPDDPETFAREVRMERPKIKVLRPVKGGKKTQSEHSG